MLFDCDGTLSRSHDAIVAAMRLAFDDHGLPMPEEERITPLIGMSLPRVLQPLARDLGHALTEPELQRLATRYRQRYHQQEHRVSLFPGVMPGLRELHEHGYWLGIVTGKSRAGLDRLLKRFHLRDTFLCIHTADCCHSKPHPQMVLRSLEETGMDKSQTWVVGDSRFDMQMAVNANVHGIGVSYSYESAESLRKAGARSIANSFPELVEMLLA